MRSIGSVDWTVKRRDFSLLGAVTLWLWLLPAVSLPENEIATARVTFVDEPRPTKASGPFAGWIGISSCVLRTAHSSHSDK